MSDLFEATAPAITSYSAQDIEVLEGLEPVRHRPGMYIGGTDETALHHLVAEILGVSISSAYELMHDPDFPTLRVGSRMVVPKEKFIRWAEGQAGGTQK